jgi:hypothetical protein
MIEGRCTVTGGRRLPGVLKGDDSEDGGVLLDSLYIPFHTISGYFLTLDLPVFVAMTRGKVSSIARVRSKDHYHRRSPAETLHDKSWIRPYLFRGLSSFHFSQFWKGNSHIESKTTVELFEGHKQAQDTSERWYVTVGKRINSKRLSPWPSDER